LWEPRSGIPCSCVASTFWPSPNAIADANAANTFVVTNHFEFYGDATDWDFAFTELKFDFAITSDTIVVSGITVGEFIDLVERTGTF
jgi:hypothetical protein